MAARNVRIVSAAAQLAQAAGQAQMGPFEKGFSACMEGRRHTAK